MCNDKLHVEELKLKCDDLMDWRYRLEKALEYEQELNRKLREENEELQNKLRVYTQRCQEEQKQAEETFPGLSEFISHLEELNNSIKGALNE